MIKRCKLITLKMIKVNQDIIKQLRINKINEHRKLHIKDSLTSTLNTSFQIQGRFWWAKKFVGRIECSDKY
jgi:hypothetical protein